MKTFLFFLLWCSGYTKVQSQNLVPNPSFEDTVSCPDFPTPNISSAKNWDTYGGTSDYFNACANILQTLFGVPSNFAGYQSPKLGNAYAGLATWYVTVVSPYREFIGTKLIYPLITGTKYYVSCFVSNGDDNGEGPSSTNNFGFRFSTIQYYDSIGKTVPIDNFSHIHVDTIIANKTGWTRVAGSLIADSAYQYVVIGNFYDDAHTLIDTVGFIYGTGAYYYVDAVCVSTDSVYDSNWTNVPEQNLLIGYKVFPNPASQILYLQNKGKETETIVYNSLSKLVMRHKTISGINLIDISSFAEGIYLLVIDDCFCYKLLIQH